MVELGGEKARSQPVQKVKVKARARGNIQEKEAATRTRLDLWVKKLDSAGWMVLVYSVSELNLLVMFKSTVMILRHPEWIEQLMCFAFKSARVS